MNNYSSHPGIISTMSPSPSPQAKNIDYNLCQCTHNLTLPTDVNAVIKQNTLQNVIHNVRRRQTPKFRLAMLNVCLATLQGGEQTNNHVEGWNNHLQHLIGHQQPSI